MVLKDYTGSRKRNSLRVTAFVETMSASERIKQCTLIGKDLMQNYLKSLVQSLLTVHYVNNSSAISIQPGSQVGFPPHVELRSACIFLSALLWEV